MTMSMSMSLMTATMLLAPSVVVQESSHETTILCQCLFDLLEVVSCLACTLCCLCCPKASIGFSNERGRIGHREDNAEFDVFAFMLVDALGMMDADFVEGAIAFAAWSRLSKGWSGFGSRNL